MNYTADDFDSSAKTDEILCDIQRTSSRNMHSSSDFSFVDEGRRLQPSGGSGRPPRNGGGGSGMGGGSSGGGGFEPIATAVGISLTGGYIYNALQGGNADAVENEGFSLDVCLSHPTPTSDFHYHYWSPCLKKDKGFWSNTEAPPLCRDTDFCVDYPGGFTRNFAKAGQDKAYTPDNWDDVIGIAKDGHMIIGPYKENGEIWGCDRDVCNGAFVEGSYVYVGSDQFPYNLGCWGPGPDPLYQPSCTNSGCGTLRASVGGEIEMAHYLYMVSMTLFFLTSSAMVF